MTITVAYIVKNFPELSHTFIVDQITGLLDRGCRVDIFAKRRSRKTILHPQIKQYNLMDKAVYFGGQPGIFSRISNMWTTLSKNSGINFKALMRSLNVLKYGTKALSLNLPYAIAPFLKGYDIIHCQFGTMGNFGALLKELGVKGKLITTFHGYDIRLGLEKGGQIYKDLIRRGDCFLAISEYNNRHLLGFGVDREKITFHPVGVDLTRFPFKWKSMAQDRHDPSRIKLLSVGRLVPEKGYSHAIAAISTVLKRLPNLKFSYEIIGDGPLKNELQRMIDDWGLERTIQLMGPRNPYQVAQALQQSDIFLLPSVAEALPVALMESQAVGLPAVATAVGSTDQIVLSGKSGFIVPAADTDSLADKIIYLARIPDQWPNMGLMGRKNIEQHFDLNRLNDRLVQLYRQLLTHA